MEGKGKYQSWREVGNYSVWKAREEYTALRAEKGGGAIQGTFGREGGTALRWRKGEIVMTGGGGYRF